MAARRRRPTKAQQAAMEAAVEQRAAAKRAKRGRANERAAFLASTQPDVDRQALSTAVAALVAEADGGASGASPGGGGRRTRARRGPRPLAFPTGDARCGGCRSGRRSCAAVRPRAGRG